MSTRPAKMLIRIMSLTFILVSAVALVNAFADKPQSDRQSESESKASQTVNPLCYVCHYDLQEEEISVVHQQAGIGCDQCHGPSNKHMHDEMLMTQPDRLYGRAEVEPLCTMCHNFQVDHANEAVIEEFRKKWRDRPRPNGRAITSEAVCTDCHGTHNISVQGGSDSASQREVEWKPLFDGKDLKGWQKEDNSCWQVKAGSLVAPTGSGNNLGCISRDIDLENYLLSMTFRADWPVHAAMKIHSQNDASKPVAVIEILENEKLPAYTPSIRIPEKGFALKNLDPDIVDKLMFNTVILKVADDTLDLWLNGRAIGTLHIDQPEKTRIELCFLPDQENRNAKIYISEIQLKPVTQGGD